MEFAVFSRQFEYFLRASDFTSMREAAHYLGVTQPALSHAIQLLEEQVGAKLFERSRKGVVLTAAGRALVDEFKSFRGEAVERIKRALAQPTVPALRIGCQEHFFRLRLYPYLQSHKGLPPYKLYLADTFQCHAAVDSGEVDFAFFTSTDISKGLTYHPIQDDPFYVVGLSEKYAHIARAKSMDDLRNETWIDGKYPGIGMFSGQVSIVTEGMHDFKTSLLLGLGIGTVQWDYFLLNEQKLLTRAPFTPNVNSPGHPLLPPGKLPVIYLVHKSHLSKGTKRVIEAMLRHFGR